MKLFANLNRKKYLRRLLMGVLVFLVAMAQNVPWLPSILGARAWPLLPLVVAVAVCDQPVPAIVFGAFAGVLWDFSSPSHGLHAIYLAFIAFACAMLLRYILNRNAFTVALLSFLSIAIYLLLRWFGEYATLPNLSPAALARPLWRSALPSLAYTMLLTPILYALVHQIVRKTSRRQRGVLAE